MTWVWVALLLLAVLGVSLFLVLLAAISAVSDEVQRLAAYATAWRAVEKTHVIRSAAGGWEELWRAAVPTDGDTLEQNRVSRAMAELSQRLSHAGIPHQRAVRLVPVDQDGAAEALEGSGKAIRLSGSRHRVWAVNLISVPEECLAQAGVVLNAAKLAAGAGHPATTETLPARPKGR